MQKNEMEYTGVDTYVKQCYDQEELIWLPNRMSFMIQSVLGVVAGNEKEQSDKSADREALAAIVDSIDELKKQIGALVQWASEVKERLGMD